MTVQTAATPVNVELSPMQVSWGTLGDLGGTTSNVVISIKPKKVPVMEDQYGSSTLDNRLGGLDITVTTELTETRNFTQWQAAFPEATYTSNANPSETFQLLIGRSDLTYAQQLTLHPLSQVGNTNQDHVFYYAHPIETSELTYGPGKQTGMKVIWQVFPVLTGTGAPKWYKFGNQSVGP